MHTRWVVMYPIGWLTAGSIGYSGAKHQYFAQYFHISWWRHQMEIFSASLALCAGKSPIPGNSLHKGQWHWALMFSLICAWINDWINNREAGDLRRHRGHYDVNVMLWKVGIDWLQLKELSGILNIFAIFFFIHSTNCIGRLTRTLSSKFCLTSPL